MLEGIKTVLSTVGSIFGNDTPVGELIDKVTQGKLTPEELDAMKLASSDLQASYQREANLANSKWGWMSLSIMNIAGLNMLVILDLINYWAMFKQADPQIQTMVLTFDLTTAVTCFIYYIWGKSKKED